MKKEKTLASSLNRRITIEKSEKTSDGAGGFITIWKEVATLPAEIKALGDFRQGQGEFYSAMQLLTYGYYKMIIRYRRDINNKMRVSYDARIFNIRRVINQEEKNKYLILIVEEGATI